MVKQGALRGSHHRHDCIVTPAARTEGGERVDSDVLAARPGHVWYHAPSGRLLEDGLPQEWIEFSRISGGILADVSPASWLHAVYNHFEVFRYPNGIWSWIQLFY